MPADPHIITEIDPLWVNHHLNVSAPVAKRLTADVDVGVYLSGGLDSSAVAGMMKLGAEAAPRQSFNGAGDTWTPTWINLGVYWVLQIPLAWFLAGPMGMHERGVFVAVTISYSVLALVSGVLFKRGKWKLKHV